MSHVKAFSLSLTGTECGYVNFVQREDDYDIVYTTLRRTHTVTLKGNPEMVQAVHLDGNNLMVLYEQPIAKKRGTTPMLRVFSGEETKC